MKRLIEKYLQQWKNNSKRKPLILRGARQVGKTYTVREFSKANFQHFLEINLEQNKGLLSIFESKNPQNIINELSVLFNTPIIAGETLLFIDEIQKSQSAIEGLRYFYEELPNLHIIAAGSLLDHTLNEMKYSMPVGRVEYAYMYPLNFKEFLQSLNETKLIGVIENFSFDNPFSIPIHNKIKEYLRLYFFVGGMPEAVDTYNNTHDLLEVQKIHSNIITSLQHHFAKYGSRKQQDYLRDCLHYSANNIGKKVKYVNINRNVQSSHLQLALQKLEMSRIVHLIKKTKSTNIPITQYVDPYTFKPVFLDIALANHLAQIKLIDIDKLITDYEGALAEQFVGQELIASSPFYTEIKPFYWAREAKNSNAEIDYLIQKGNKIYPVEVKAGKTGTLKSMQVFLAEKNKKTGIRFNLDTPNYAKSLSASVRIKKETKELNYNLISLPLYFAGWIANVDIE